MDKVIYLGSEEGYYSSVEVLKDIATVEHISANPETVSNSLKYADALIDASMKVKITDQMIYDALNLKIISCATTGSDHIERNILKERKILVSTLKEDPELLLNITPAAELTWALLISCARLLPAAVKHVQNGGWTRELFPGIMLNGRKLGLVGCGRIGNWMAKYATAFGMKVVGYDPYLKNWPDYIEQITLEELIETSDFISIHVHLSNETEGLISEELLKKVKNGCVVINTSRGAIIDEKALLEGLKSKQIYAVGLDVLTGEPDIENNPLVQYARNNDNVLITPHCGGFSPDAVRLVCEHAAKKVRTVLLNKINI
jgi:D-3-phosphoglycerate dehydrogenase